MTILIFIRKDRGITKRSRGLGGGFPKRPRLATKGGGGSKFSKNWPRSLWMAPKEDSRHFQDD